MSLFSFLSGPRYDKGAELLSGDDWEKAIIMAFPGIEPRIGDGEYLALEDERLLKMCRAQIWLPRGGYRAESNDCDNAAAIARGLLLKYAAEHGFKRQPAIAEFDHITADGEPHAALLMIGKSGRLIYFDPQDFTHSYEMGKVVREGWAVWG